MRDEIEDIESLSDPNTEQMGQQGRWTKEEHSKFIEAINIYGKNWKKVEEMVKTRSGTQI